MNSYPPDLFFGVPSPGVLGKPMFGLTECFMQQTEASFLSDHDTAVSRKDEWRNRSVRSWPREFLVEHGNYKATYRMEGGVESNGCKSATYRLVSLFPLAVPHSIVVIDKS